MRRNVFLAGLAVLVSVSCGGGDDEDESSPPGSITIESPSTDPYTAGPAATVVVLSGTASNANFITNCLVGGQQNIADIGTTVTWVNAAGGSGTASQSVNCSTLTGTGGGNGWLCANSGGLCKVGHHNWTASIPIVPGTNVVTMTVTGPWGVARDTITLIR